MKRWEWPDSWDWNEWVLDELELGSRVAGWLEMENVENLTAAHWMSLDRGAA